MNDSTDTNSGRAPWNKGKLIGQKLPLKQREIWRIRANLEHEYNVRELAMFDLAIDSKLRACDLTSLRVRDVMRGDQVQGRRLWEIGTRRRSSGDRNSPCLSTNERCCRR